MYVSSHPMHCFCLNSHMPNCSERSKNMYLHFISLLHNDMKQVAEIFHRVRQELTYSTYSVLWVLMSWWPRKPGIINDDTDQVKPGLLGPRT